MKNLFADMLVEKVAEYTSQLRKCPFCGCEISITICDDEGNEKPLDYLDDPYSGIAFKINHDNGGCVLCDFNEISPIYSDENDDFDKALAQLVADWNGGAKMKDQDEMFEMATETPVAKLLACNERMRACVAEIAHLANECLLNTNHPTGYEPGQYGKDNRIYGKAMSETLKLVDEQLGESVTNARKPTMDFGSFHVTRAAIPGTTILTFRRKRHVDAEHGSVVPGRIIVAKIFKSDVGKDNKLTNQFVVKSYEAGEHPRVLFSGQTWVNMSKTEKMVYKMVKCNVKETQRRHISRKRARAARSEFENGGRA